MYGYLEKKSPYKTKSQKKNQIVNRDILGKPTRASFRGKNEQYQTKTDMGLEKRD